jgi:hypothetical protein
MSNTAEHNLTALVGKTIQSITVKEVDMYGDRANVMQFYTVNCTDGEQLILAADGHCTSQYATITVMTPSRYGDLLDDVAENVGEEDESAEECCQKCRMMFYPDNVLILDDLGPVCKDCCTVDDVKLAINQGSLDTDGETPEEFLDQWRADGPV